jgi:hypothetical protein
MPAKKQTANTPQKPVHEIRLGRVRATFWEQQSKEEGKANFMTVTFSRLYKNAEGEWRDSKSFFASDLLLLAKTADAAHSHLCASEGK